jgi:hypothetical protein
MPWKASSVMEEKLRFVFEYEKDEQTMRELCQSFGMARETGRCGCGDTEGSGWPGWWN